MSLQTGTAGFWYTALNKVELKVECVLLIVVDSDGSSPGRAGFKMLVSADGSLVGSIGGGRLEHDLVEEAREKIRNKEEKINCRKYFHDEEPDEKQSGMICSGSQFVASIPLTLNVTEILKQITEVVGNNKEGLIDITFEGINFTDGEFSGPDITFSYNDEMDWHYTEKTGILKNIHIVGGGHCGFALSKIMKDLGFYVIIYDDREEITSMKDNIYANEKKLIQYEKIGDIIKDGEKEYIAIMTFGHLADELVLKQLIRKKVKYIGMMGSAAKVKQIFENLKIAGYTAEELENIHSPIGIPIFSKTPEEIAISIAAEIIKIKNM